MEYCKTKSFESSLLCLESSGGFLSVGFDPCLVELRWTVREEQCQLSESLGLVDLMRVLGGIPLVLKSLMRPSGAVNQ